jgi:hypothetical protein
MRGKYGRYQLLRALGCLVDDTASARIIHQYVLFGHLNLYIEEVICINSFS